MHLAVKFLGAALAWEGAWWARRRAKRTSVYREAWQRARALGRPLVVVGAPDGGVTAGYDCGDITIDLAESSCPVTLRANIEEPLPFDDDSCVVFVACVLEYVNDFDAALAELRRVGGEHVFVVRVEPFTATAYLYPGAKRTLPAHLTRAGPLASHGDAVHPSLTYGRFSG